MSLPTFFAEEPVRVAALLGLGEDAAHHMRVRRLDVGARVRVIDGCGTRGEGLVTQLGKRQATVAIEVVMTSAPPSAIHLLVPVADKDRMLWVAEKATELGVASWRPVVFRRSRDVASRGTGPQFHQRVRARIIAALEQSGGAWLPSIYPEAKLEAAIAARSDGLTLLLDPAGPPILEVLQAERPQVVHLVVGPEGGIEPAEEEALRAAGAQAVSVGNAILRFETACLTGVAIATGWFHASESPTMANGEGAS